MRRGTPAAIKFGKLLYNIRINNNMTMGHLGRTLGVPTATISKIEKAQRALKDDKLSKWAIALEIDENYLREQWFLCQIEPDPPIIRKRDKSINRDKLYILISTLSATNKHRVLGYVEALIETETKKNNK